MLKGKLEKKHKQNRSVPLLHYRHGKKVTRRGMLKSSAVLTFKHTRKDQHEGLDANNSSKFQTNLLRTCSLEQVVGAWRQHLPGSPVDERTFCWWAEIRQIPGAMICQFGSNLARNWPVTWLVFPRIRSDGWVPALNKEEDQDKGSAGMENMWERLHFGVLRPYLSETNHKIRKLYPRKVSYPVSISTSSVHLHPGLAQYRESSWVLVILWF